jgi:hypothetical protein
MYACMYVSMYVWMYICILKFCQGFWDLISGFETFVFLRREVVSLSPNPQPGRPGYLF